MTFDDIIASGDLTRRSMGHATVHRQTMDAAVSAATKKKLSGHSRTAACCFRSHPTRPHVTRTTVQQAVGPQIDSRKSKGKRQRVLFMAAHESKGLHYIGFNDGRSVRQWIFNKQTIDQAAVDHALKALSESEGRDLLIIPTGPVVFMCRLLTRGMALK